MKTRLIYIFPLIACLAILALASPGQGDPDPNSPAPVLLAGPDRERALAVDHRDWQGTVPATGPSVFVPSEKANLVVFVKGLELMEGEAANAVRVFVQQRSGRTYEMDVVELTRVRKDAFAVRFRLFDRSEFRGQPRPDGDSLIYVTWRGNASNFLKIGLGSTGGIEIPKRGEPYLQREEDRFELVGYHFAADRKRFSEQAAFGPSAMLDNRLRRIGLRTWLADQFDLPYPSIPYPDSPQSTTNPPANCTPTSNPFCYRETYTMVPLQKWFFTEAFYGQAQLRHRTAWALGQIWVTSGLTIQQSSHAIAYHKILAGNAFGNYRQLMRDVTLSPTMGQYLDMVRSTRTNPNENYPREILQLFTIGLYMLNPDGTRQLDKDGQPIPTYTQDTINDLSRVFTGWTFCNFTCENSAPSIVNYRDPMVLLPANHDLGAKTLLQYPGAPHSSIPACTDCNTPEAIEAYAYQSLDRALDNIFHHPNLGPFIGKLMIQQLVTSDPSPAYVARVASAFNGTSTTGRGDMKALLRAVLLDPEARGDIKTAPRYGKLREPVQLLTNLARIFPAMDYNKTARSDGALSSYSTQLGQNPFYSPTVFNYFSPDYNVPGTTILAPEFELLNTGTAVKRTNFLHVFIFEGVTANSTDSLRGTSLDYSEYVPVAANDPSGEQLVNYLNERMMHGAMVQEQREAILSAVAAVHASNPLQRVKTAVYLIAVSSQYQIQR